MKRVCFFSGDITRCGGTERVSIAIANELAKEGKYEVMFISLVEQKNKIFFELDPSIKHFALGDKWISPGPEYLPLIGKLRRFLKSNDVDVIVDIDIVLDVLSIPASKGLKTKVVSWDHFNFDFEMEVMYRKVILWYSVKRSDYVITLTKENQERYAKDLKRTKNICTIYNPAPSIPKEDAGRKKWIISIGNLVYEKGVDYLLDVAGKVLERHKDWLWLVLGDGNKRSYMEEEINKRGLENKLLLKGRVENVGKYLSKSSIFVLTSRREGLPMCLLEAKAYSIPCVSFNIHTGPAEIIDDNINGYLVEPYDCDKMADAISKLISDDDLRNDFSRNSLNGMEKFELKQIIAGWNEVLSKICD